MTALEDVRGLFDPAPGYLNTASIGVPPRPAADAMEAVLADWRRGCAEPEAYDAPVTRSRVALARLLDAPPDSVATGATASGLIGLLPMSAVQSVNGALVHFAAVRAAAGVRTARRAGATRFSFHLYTDLSDVDSMVAAIKGQS